MAEQQKFSVKISKLYDPETRAAIAVDIIDRIVERTKSGKDKKGKDFKGYSKEYKDSFDFKLGGKSSKVNLTLSGEMLNSLTLLESKEGELVIGIPADDDFNNGKAQGNIEGTYGQDEPIRGKKRDFMGIKRSELSDITSDYKVNNKKERDKTKEKVFKNLLATAASTEIAENFLDVEAIEAVVDGL